MKRALVAGALLCSLAHLATSPGDAAAYTFPERWRTSPGPMEIMEGSRRVADFDGDGRPEIAHLFWIPGDRLQLRIHGIDGALEYEGPPMRPSSFEVEVLDVNQDGTLDYALHGPILPSLTANFAVFGKLDGYGVLDSLSTPSGVPPEVDWFYAQLEPDAPLELVFTRWSSTTYIGRVMLHLYGGNGFAADIVPGGTTGSAPFAEALDLNGNGLAELYVSYGGQLFMYASEGAVASTPGSPAAPRTLDLGTPRPNPSSGDAVLRFSLAHDADATIRILDAAGRRVRVLPLGRLGAGEHEARWDGRDEDRRPVAPGVYWMELDGDGARASRRFVRLR